MGGTFRELLLSGGLVSRYIRIFSKNGWYDYVTDVCMTATQVHRSSRSAHVPNPPLTHTRATRSHPGATGTPGTRKERDGHTRRLHRSCPVPVPLPAGKRGGVARADERRRGMGVAE